MKVTKEGVKASLKLNIKKTKITASSPITSWQRDGGKIERVTELILGGSKITADGDSSHEIKRCLLLGRKVMTNLDSILKSRDITLPTKAHIIKAMVFPVVMYGCECCTIKKAECQRMDALDCGVGEDTCMSLGQQGDQTSQSYTKSVLNIHWKDWCWCSNTLATWCEVNSLEKTLMLGKIEGGRRRWLQRIKCLDGVTNSLDISLSKLQEMKDSEDWCATDHGFAKCWTRLSSWTTTRI